MSLSSAEKSNRSPFRLRAGARAVFEKRVGAKFPPKKKTIVYDNHNVGADEEGRLLRPGFPTARVAPC